MNTPTYRRRSAIMLAMAIILAAAVLVVWNWPPSPRRGAVPATESAAGNSSDSISEPPFIAAESAVVSSGQPEPPAVAASLRAQLEGILKTEKDAMEWPGALYVLCKNMDEKQLQDLLALGAEKGWPKLLQDFIQVAAHDRWVELDPVAAIRSAGQGGVPAARLSEWLRISIGLWAAKSPDEVFAYLKSGDLRGLDLPGAYRTLAEGAATQGNRSAVDTALAQVHGPEARSAMVRRLVAIWAQTRDAGFVNDWVAGLPAAEQAAAYMESAVQFSVSNPELTATTLEQLASLAQTDPSQYYLMTTRVLIRWTEADPAAAADWFTTQRFEPAQQSMLLKELLHIWQRQDREAPINWLEACLKKGTLEELVIQRAVENY